MVDNHYINFKVGEKSLSEYHNLYLKRFYEDELDQTKNSLRLSHKNKNWLEVNKILSSLKGTSGFVGALTCKMHVESLQNALTDSELNEESVKILFNQLLDHLEKLSEYLSGYFCKSKLKEKDLEKGVEERLMITEDTGKVVVVKKIVPPISRILKSDYKFDCYRDEIDYEEVCKQWSCLII